jgi:hypothetical protein
MRWTSGGVMVLIGADFPNMKPNILVSSSIAATPVPAVASDICGVSHKRRRGTSQLREIRDRRLVFQARGLRKKDIAAVRYVFGSGRLTGRFRSGR